MPTHPLRRPFELTDLDQSDAAVIGTAPPGTVRVVPYDESWPAMADALIAAIREVLGDRVVELDHVGSTSVPGLAAKPVIDLDLVVPDPADEAAYVPALESLGLLLHIREPDWEEHRLLTRVDRSVNLHVFGPAAAEPRRCLLFRDWLRSHPQDRDAYGGLKASLAAQGFERVMDYNNHKAAMVYDIYEKAFAADPEHDHDPQPRE
ncbi:GrpB family protein [Nocardioides dilutus]